MRELCYADIILGEGEEEANEMDLKVKKKKDKKWTDWIRSKEAGRCLGASKHQHIRLRIQ